MNKDIKKYLRDSMKGYGVYSRKLESRLNQTFSEKYYSLISAGVESETAREQVYAYIDTKLKTLVIPKNKYLFPFLMGILAVCISSFELFFSLMYNLVYFYSGEMGIVTGGIAIIIILYLILARRSYRWYDFLVMGIMLVSWGASFFQIFPFIFSTGEGGSRALDYIFPCVITITTYINKWVTEPTITYVFCPNFLVGAGIFITTLIMFIKQRAKIKARYLFYNEV